MSVATDNVDSEIRKYIINNGPVPLLVKVSRVDFADLFINFLTEDLGVLTFGGDSVHAYRGVTLDIMENEHD